MKLPAELHEKIEAHVAALGLECVEITFAVEAGRRILRVTLDSEAGIGLDACARVSRSLGPVLDAHGELLPGYYLEVSSPGINRPLTKPEHFRRFRGEVVKVRLLEEQDGGRSLTGVIGDLDEGVLTVETPAGTRKVPLARIARARLHRDLDRLLRPRKR